MKAVRFDNYNSVDVLRVADVPLPEPAQGEVLVNVEEAAIYGAGRGRTAQQAVAAASKAWTRGVELPVTFTSATQIKRISL